MCKNIQASVKVAVDADAFVDKHLHTATHIVILIDVYFGCFYLSCQMIAYFQNRFFVPVNRIYCWQLNNKVVVVIRNGDNKCEIMIFK